MGALPIGDKVPDHGLFSPEEVSGSSGRSFHAYVHIPFCTTRCGYCDFNTYTASELGTLKQSDYSKSVISEIAFSAEVLERSGVEPRKFETVFFGGGTPSLMASADLIGILESLKNQYGFASEAEVTMEANPDSLDGSSLAQLREAGFNRISIGMQSGDPEVLRTLERSHNPANVSKALASAKNEGFDTSLDLIYGAPGESLESWKTSVAKAIELSPGHISAYGLIVEPGTKLARQIAKGELGEVNDDLQADKYELADQMLAAAGYKWYEISNFAQPGKRSKHNLAYWLGQDWWGYGPGAHSHVGSVRFWNQKHPLTYSQRLADFKSPAIGKELISAELDGLERVLLEIRLSDGMPIQRIKNFFPQSAKSIPGLIAQELIDGPRAIAGEAVLTLKGRLLADGVVRTLTQ